MFFKFSGKAFKNFYQSKKAKGKKKWKPYPVDKKTQHFYLNLSRTIFYVLIVTLTSFAFPTKRKTTSYSLLIKEASMVTPFLLCFFFTYYDTIMHINIRQLEFKDYIEFIKYSMNIPPKIWLAVLARLIITLMRIDSILQHLTSGVCACENDDSLAAYTYLTSTPPSPPCGVYATDDTIVSVLGRELMMTQL